MLMMLYLSTIISVFLKKRGNHIFKEEGCSVIIQKAAFGRAVTNTTAQIRSFRF